MTQSKRSGVLLVAIGALVAATPAAARIVDTPTGAVISVRVVRGDCPIVTANEATSCTYPDGKTIYLQRDLGAAYSMIWWHEVAHALYFQGRLSGAAQARFRQLVGYSSTIDWMTPSGTSLTGLPITLEEIFAEAYSYCVTTPRSGPISWGDAEPGGEFGWDPRRKQRVQTCDMLYRNLR